MKYFALLLSASAMAFTLGAAPVLAQTANKVMLTQVDPATLTTAWRATTIIGAGVHDDLGNTIGTLQDLLVATGATVPYAIIKTDPTNKGDTRSVVVSTANFELVGNKLTMHNVTAQDLMNLPNF